MATVNVRRRNHRTRITAPAFTPGTFSTNQVVTPTGAARAIRPQRTAIRFMNNSGAGSVGYV